MTARAALAQRLAGRDRGRGVVGINIGMNKGAADPGADFVRGLELLGGLADYVTVNVSSPNTPGLRALQQRAALGRLLAALAPKRAGTPLFLKVAPDLEALGRSGHRGAVCRARHRRADREQHHDRPPGSACARHWRPRPEG